MEVIIRGNEKEIADLVQELQGQRQLLESEIKSIYREFCRRTLEARNTPRVR